MVRRGRRPNSQQFTPYAWMPVQLTALTGGLSDQLDATLFQHIHAVVGITMEDEIAFAVFRMLQMRQ